MPFSTKCEKARLFACVFACKQKIFAAKKRYDVCMKNNVLRAQRRTFPSFDFRLSKKTAVNFTVECLAIFLLASVKDFGFCLSLALFCGLVFARQNVLAISPCFVLANCVFSLEWLTLAYAVTPVAVLFLTYLIFFKLKRNVPLFCVALAALVSLCPYIACKAVFEQAYLNVGISALILVTFTFCAGNTAYAIFVRGVIHKATVDELICGGVCLCVFGYALAGVGGYGFYAVTAALAFCTLFCTCCFSQKVTLFVGILIGVGAACKNAQLAYLGHAAAIATCAVAFSPFTRFSSALAMIACEGVFWLFDAYSGAGWQSLCMLAAGTIACLCVPPSALARVKSSVASDNRHAYTAVVNRRARELAARISGASDVFYDMSKNLERIAQSSGECSPLSLAKEVAKSFCGKCKDREGCFCALGSDTAPVLQPMAEAALNRGRVTILDMPPFITGRCSNMHALASVINSSAKAYLERMDELKNIATCKNLMSEQFAGVSLVLDSLATSCARQVNFAGDDVEMLKSEYLKHNIVASEILISGDGQSTCVTMIVRASDAQKTVIAKIASSFLRVRLQVDKITDKGEQKVVYLQSAPTFETAYGVASHKFSGESESGDTISILCPSASKRLFAICDGMGHGSEASNASKNAVNMIENFYRAGIESNIILALANKLLRLCADDVFSTLDIAVADTVSGALDVVKLGSSASFIIRKDNIEMLSCSGAPIGILDSVDSVTVKYQLFDGDMVLMMSDGVFDTLASEGIAEIVDTLDTSNPQLLADEILRKALENGASDDCSVVAFRLFSV